MKLELRETCQRFKEAMIKDFDERLNELKDQQPQFKYNREKHKVYKRYYNWILGYADELGNQYTNKQRIENSDKVKQMLVDHMVRLTGNKALGIWLERANSHEWEKIIWEMYDVDKIHYSRVLYRFTHAVICKYLHKWSEIFIVNWGKEEGGEMYKTLEQQLVRCLNPKECSYWNTIEE